MELIGILKSIKYFTLNKGFNFQGRIIVFATLTPTIAKGSA